MIFMGKMPHQTRSGSRKLVLAKDGRSDYVIVVGEEASPSELHAADELQKFLYEISGCRIPVVKDGQKTTENMIIVGRNKALTALKQKIDFEDLGNEGFMIRTLGNHLVLAGGRLRGTMYAVYTFLEERLGCRWYTSKVSYIPKMREVVIEHTDEKRKPSFEWRMVSYLDAQDRDFSARNKLNGVFHNLDKATGGRHVILYDSHNFYQLVPPEKYYKTHPEYYSLIDGKRKWEYGQLCLTNPEVLEIVKQGIFKWIEEFPDCVGYGFVQNDWAGWCECENCKSINIKEGTNAGTLVHFVNKLAEQVGKKYPDKYVMTYSYTITENAPKEVKPRDNVLVRVSHMYPSCDSHPVTDPVKCEKNARFMENVKKWRQITKKVYVKHYAVDFAHYFLPFPNFGALAESVRWYKDIGVEGIHFQGDSMSGGGGEFEELRAYVLAKLLWNAYVDVGQIIDDFLRGYYGKAARPIREYLNMLNDKVRDEHICMHLYSGPEAGYLTPEVLQQANKYFDEAERLADNEEILDRVRKTRISIQYAQLTMPVEHVLFEGSVYPIPLDLPREYLPFLKQPAYVDLFRAKLDEGLVYRQKLVKQFIESIQKSGIMYHQEFVPIGEFLERIKAEAQKYPAMVVQSLSIPVREGMEALASWIEQYKEPELTVKTGDSKELGKLIDVHDLTRQAKSLGLPAGWASGVIGWFMDRGILKRSDVHLWLVRWVSSERKKENSA